MNTNSTSVPPASTSHADEVLEALRCDLDAIDARLLQTIHARLQCCKRIGHHKKQHGVPMMQPHRIGVVQRRAAEFAASHGVSGSFLKALYDLVIAETCRLEDQIIGSAASQ